MITKCERNEIMELGGKNAYQQLEAIYRELPTHEQRILQNGLQIGVAMNEYTDSFEYGDFLIRNVTGIDHETGVIQVADFLRVGQTVQFHLRDSTSAILDLKQTLQISMAENRPFAPASLLAFTCNGRGSDFFEASSGDAQTISETIGDLPVAGFFAAGEIGPVSGRNFMHGFTCSCIWFGE
ncbi:MAG: FIST C-terminal domain-containing protein [Pirellulaceae bacterium]